MVIRERNKRQMGGYTERWMANHIELGTKIEDGLLNVDQMDGKA